MGIYRVESSPYWHYSFKLAGRPQQRGSTGYEDRKLANAKYHKIRGEAQQNQDFKKPIKMAVRELLDWANRSHWRYEKWESECRPLLDHFGGAIAGGIGVQELLNYRDDRLRRGIAKASINRELALLKAAYNYAIDCEKLRENPVTKIKFFRCADNKRDKYLRPDEKLQVVERARGIIREVIIFAMNTGMRQGEIVGLKWENVDQDRQQMKVISYKGDQVIIRYVPIFRQALEVLERQPRTSDYVFADVEGQRLKESFVTHSFTRIARATGVQGGDFRFHDLRHTFASDFLMMGKSLAALQRILGHTKADTTNRYAHLSKEYLQAAMDTLPYVNYEQKKAGIYQSGSTVAQDGMAGSPKIA